MWRMPFEFEELRTRAVDNVYVSMVYDAICSKLRIVVVL